MRPITPIIVALALGSLATAAWSEPVDKNAVKSSAQSSAKNAAKTLATAKNESVNAAGSSLSHSLKMDGQKAIATEAMNASVKAAGQDSPPAQIPEAQRSSFAGKPAAKAAVSAMANDASKGFAAANTVRRDFSAAPANAEIAKHDDLMNKRR